MLARKRLHPERRKGPCLFTHVTSRSYVSSTSGRTFLNYPKIRQAIVFPHKRKGNVLNQKCKHRPSVCTVVPRGENLVFILFHCICVFDICCCCCKDRLGTSFSRTNRKARSPIIRIATANPLKLQ
jgi:hypothetical protein